MGKYAKVIINLILGIIAIYWIIRFLIFVFRLSVGLFVIICRPILKLSTVYSIEKWLARNELRKAIFWKAKELAKKGYTEDKIKEIIMSDYGVEL